MHYSYLLLILLAASAACVGDIEGKYENYQNYQVYAGFFNEFQRLISEWNKITTMHVIRTSKGFHIYVDSSFSFANVPCSNRMAPTFDCTDVLIEYQPRQQDLREGDVVSFSIYSDEARSFGEEAFSEKKTIQRRIYRILNESQVYYYIMKRDASETTHPTRVPFDRIRGKVIGFIFDAGVVGNPNEPYTSPDKKIEDYNMLVDKWNTFVGNVYAGSISSGSFGGSYPLFYEKGISVQSLACTGSMKPTIDCEDLVFAYRPFSEAELEAGDIVSFRIAPNETAGFLEPPANQTIHVMHRIFRVTKTRDNQTAFITKGDNPVTNAQTDAIYLSFSRVEGKLAAFFKDSFNTTFQK